MRRRGWLAPAIALTMACAETPVVIPLDEPVRMTLSGTGQCAKEGTAFGIPVVVSLTNVEGDPIVDREVVIRTTGATFDNLTRDVRRTSASGTIQVLMVADALDSSAAEGHASVEAVVSDRPHVGAEGGFLVAQRAWLSIVEPDSAVLCRAADGELHVIIDCVIAVKWGCDELEASPSRILVEANQSQPGAFQQVSDLMVDANGLATGRLNVTLRTWDVTVRVRDKDGMAPNQPEFLISHCGAPAAIR